ncbi:DUF835 domain-containing protein [Candidatus Woesearchaeota archaeon]|nr:DUF835 domain-containing protein [Candidatus Woesearchaeota archaeon]
MKKQTFWMIVMVLLVLPLATSKAEIEYLDEVEIEMYAGDNIVYTITVENKLNKYSDFETGLAGEVTEFATMERMLNIGPYESVKMHIPIKVPKNQTTGIYRGDIVITGKQETTVIPIKVNIKGELKDIFIFDIISKNMIDYTEDLKVLVQIDNKDKRHADIELELYLEDINTNDAVLKSGELFSTSTSISKEIFMPSLKTIPTGNYLLIGKIYIKTKDQSGTVVIRKEVFVQGIETPSPKSKAWLWWIMMIFIFSGVFTVYGTQVYQYQYSFGPFKKEEIQRDNKQETEESYCYLIEEEDTTTSFSIFSNLMDKGYKGLCISRESPQHLLNRHYIDEAEIKWLTTMKAEDAVGPTDIEEIYNMIEEFVDINDRSVIILDGLYYLIVNSSFEQVLLLLQYLKDKISTTNSILIAPMDLGVLDRKQGVMISKELVVINGGEEVRIDKKESKVKIPDMLVDYVRMNIKKMESQDIENILIEYGWDKRTVNKAIELVEKGVTPQQEESKTVKKEKKDILESKEVKIEEVIDDMMRELEGEVFGKKEETPDQEIKKQEVVDLLTQKINELKQNLKKIKELIIEEIERGRDTSKFDMQLALISNDIDMIRITKNESNIDQVKNKIRDLKKDLINQKKKQSVTFI